MVVVYQYKIYIDKYTHSYKRMYINTNTFKCEIAHIYINTNIIHIHQGYWTGPI